MFHKQALRLFRVQPEQGRGTTPSTWNAFEALVRQQFHSGNLGTGKGLGLA